MKIAKRIISFMMAMVIFASFFCYNIGAAGRREVYYPYSASFVQEYFSDTEAYAAVIIRDWAEEENTTDLRASTYAHIDDYNYLDNFYEAFTWVNLEVWLEDGSDNRVSDFGYVEEDGGTIGALVRGEDCLSSEYHHSIVDFKSTHEVLFAVRSYDEFGNNRPIYENDGPVIIITTID